MSKARRTYAIEMIREAARQVNSRAEFAKEYPQEYQYAWRHSLLDDVCGHMPISPIYSLTRWDWGSASEEAKKYKSRSEFKRECSGAYCYLKDHGMLDDACAHMRKPWNAQTVAEEAKKYTSKLEFMKSPGYKFAQANGLIDAICAHMEGKRRWNKQRVLDEAAKYRNRDDFRAAAPGAYQHAHRARFVDEACAHMEPGKCGFDPKKPAVLYYLKISRTGEAPLYKIGITNRDARLRIHGMGVGEGIAVEVLKEVEFERGADARSLEKKLHVKFFKARYSGPAVLGNGNKELFISDVLSNFPI